MCMRYVKCIGSFSPEAPKMTYKTFFIAKNGRLRSQFVPSFVYQVGVALQYEGVTHFPFSSEHFFDGPTIKGALPPWKQNKAEYLEHAPAYADYPYVGWHSYWRPQIGDRTWTISMPVLVWGVIHTGFSHYYNDNGPDALASEWLFIPQRGFHHFTYKMLLQHFQDTGMQDYALAKQKEPD